MTISEASTVKCQRICSVHSFVFGASQRSRSRYVGLRGSRTDGNNTNALDLYSAVSISQSLCVMYFEGRKGSCLLFKLTLTSERISKFHLLICIISPHLTNHLYYCLFHSQLIQENHLITINPSDTVCYAPSSSRRIIKMMIKNRTPSADYIIQALAEPSCFIPKPWR
jgi:hypothetical protein